MNRYALALGRKGFTDTFVEAATADWVAGDTKSPDTRALLLKILCGEIDEPVKGYLTIWRQERPGTEREVVYNSASLRLTDLNGSLSLVKQITMDHNFLGLLFIEGSFKIGGKSLTRKRLCMICNTEETLSLNFTLDF